MDAVLRGAVIYLVLLLIFRLTGKRTLSQITTFDLVLLLIIGEATQQALLGDNYSITNALLVIVTLVVIDLVLAQLKQRSRRLDKWIDGVPLVIVENGRPLKDRMAKVRVDESDVLTAARETQGLERMEQIKYAVLERSGGISIIPAQQ
jgi:uncharacterized membrane protein YcaP (DUF421 family)